MSFSLYFLSQSLRPHLQQKIKNYDHFGPWVRVWPLNKSAHLSFKRSVLNLSINLHPNHILLIYMVFLLKLQGFFYKLVYLRLSYLVPVNTNCILIALFDPQNYDFIQSTTLNIIKYVFTHK